MCIYCLSWDYHGDDDDGCVVCLGGCVWGNGSGRFKIGAVPRWLLTTRLFSSHVLNHGTNHLLLATQRIRRHWCYCPCTCFLEWHIQFCTFLSRLVGGSQQSQNQLALGNSAARQRFLCTASHHLPVSPIEWFEQQWTRTGRSCFSAPFGACHNHWYYSLHKSINEPSEESRGYDG